MKKNTLRAVAAVAAFVFAAPAAAEWSPPGPVKLLIAFRAGGGADTQARAIAKELEARHGWRVIPEQATGKGGVNLLVKLKDMPADGTAIGMVVSETLAYNLSSQKNAPAKFEDFAPLASTASFQMGIVAKTEKGWKTLGDVIAAAKGGKQIRFGTMSPRIADVAYTIGKNNGVKFNIVSARGGKGVMNGLNAGDMDVGFVAGIQAKAVKAGEMVNLASAIPEALDMSPDAPLLSEYNTPFTADGYFLFVAPAGLPEDARREISEAIAEIARDKNSEAGKFIARAFKPHILTGAPLEKSLAQIRKQDSEMLRVVGE